VSCLGECLSLYLIVPKPPLEVCQNLSLKFFWTLSVMKLTFVVVYKIRVFTIGEKNILSEFLNIVIGRRL